MADPPDGLLGRIFPGNDPAALYGGALTDPATQAQMAQRGLLAMAGSFADSAMPTRMPTPFGAVLGHAAAALGTSGDAVMQARLQAAQAQQAMAVTGAYNQLGPFYQAYVEEAKRLAAGGTPGGGAPAPGTTAGGATGGSVPSTGGVSFDELAGGVKGSWFGNSEGWEDKNDSGLQASGLPVAGNPGIALPIPKSSPDFGKLYNVTTPDGRTFQLRQTDVGPATKTGRGVDINSEAAKVMNYTPKTFPTDGKFKVELAANQVLAGTSPGGTGAPPGATQTAAAPRGLLNLADPTGATDRMNAPIPGIAGNVSPPVAPGTPSPAAAALPPGAAGAALVAAQQRNSAPGALAGGPVSGLLSMADASGKVPIPSGAAAPNLVPGGAIAAPPPAAPAGSPQSLIPPPPSAPPVPPVARPPQAAPAPSAAPTGPPVAPPINLPPIPTNMPPMPGGMGAATATPLQMIAQGIAGISSLTGHPAPQFMQDIAAQPVQMQMERYKAWVGAQANMMTEQYKKQIEITAAGTISYLQSQGQLPADLTKMTNEQNLKLRNEMVVQHGLVQGPDGNWKLDPAWLDAQGRKAVADAQAKAQFTMVDVPVKDPVTGQIVNQKMTAAQASALSPGGGVAGPGIPGIAGGTAAPGTPGAAAPSTAPGFQGLPLLTPEQEMQQKGVGETLSGEYKSVAEDQTNSQKAKPFLLSIQQAQQIFDSPGAGAAERLGAWKAVQSAAQMAGLPVPEGLQDWIAKGEIMGKSGTNLGFELAKSLGSRESQMIVQQAVANNPGLGTSAQGNKDLIALLGSIIDRSDAKRAFYDNWYQSHNKSFVGAQTTFNKANPWEVTVSQFAPYQADKIDKATYDKLPAGVKVTKTDGSYWIKPGGQ
jgi:hypothetical protein